MGKSPKPKTPKDTYPAWSCTVDSGIYPRHIFIHWYLCPDLGRVMPGFPCSNMPDMVFPQEKRIQLYEMASRFDSGVPHNLSPAPGRGSFSQSGKFL